MTTAQHSRLGRATRNPDLMQTTLGFIAFDPAYGPAYPTWLTQ